MGGAANSHGVSAAQRNPKQTANMQLTASQFDTVYNCTSFGLACMMASTTFTPGEVVDGVVNYGKCDPEEFGYSATGHSFNDAYRYMDWLLTVPLLLIEIVLVMKLSPEETKKQSLRLGVLSGLMIL